MIRPLLIAGTMTSFALLAACQNDTRAMSDTSSGYTDYGHFDENGNRVYGRSDAANTPARDASNSRAVTIPSNTPASSGSNGPSYVAGDRVYTNNPGTPAREYGVTNTTQPQSNSAADWSAAWNDRNASRISASDLPQSVRNTLSAEANGADLSDTTKGTWNGQTAYCAKVMKNGHTYKMVTDANGNLITSRIID